MRSFKSEWDQGCMDWNDHAEISQPCRFCGAATLGRMNYFTDMSSMANSATCQSCALRVLQQAVGQ